MTAKCDGYLPLIIGYMRLPPISEQDDHYITLGGEKKTINANSSEISWTSKRPRHGQDEPKGQQLIYGGLGGGKNRCRQEHKSGNIAVYWRFHTLLFLLFLSSFYFSYTLTQACLTGRVHR
ncbi:hypothetical protein BDZ91DRAFT_722778 [Kalaharituber pfeilii]|nr:hypothetical protein BDZ91DRAFT_722778 [Kalaharituber pfeilii]